MNRKEVVIEKVMGGFVVTDEKFGKRIFDRIEDVTTFIKNHFTEK